MSESVSVFVYGTLKRGYRNHERFCGGYETCQAARGVGRLWRHPRGYPMLQVDDPAALVRGTADRAADCRTLSEMKPTHPPTGGPVVRGELLSWTVGGAQVLRALDRLEWFRPEDGRPATSEYWRVALPVVPESGESVMAWAYVLPPGSRPAGLSRIDGGAWTGDRRTASDRPGAF